MRCSLRVPASRRAPPGRQDEREERTMRPNVTHVRQSRPDSGLGFQVKVLHTSQGVPFSTRNGKVEAFQLSGEHLGVARVRGAKGTSWKMIRTVT